jgi:hypothetical protein
MTAKSKSKEYLNKSGTVVRYMMNGDLQALYANGDYSVNNTKMKDLVTTEYTGNNVCNI